jgi:hypothetical protein
VGTRIESRTVYPDEPAILPSSLSPAYFVGSSKLERRALRAARRLSGAMERVSVGGQQYRDVNEGVGAVVGSTNDAELVGARESAQGASRAGCCGGRSRPHDTV